eukprot:4652801-Ditylum_brightwellii.AAC.1
MKHSQTALMGKHQRDHAPTKINLTNMSLTPPFNMIINNQRLAEINLENMRSTPHLPDLSQTKTPGRCGKLNIQCKLVKKI